ncbi:tektin-1 isoform X2 [Nothobranchius furzeri]
MTPRPSNRWFGTTGLRDLFLFVCGNFNRQDLSVGTRAMSALKPSLQQAGEPDLGHIQAMLNHHELFRGECKRLIVETDQVCARMHDDNVKHLDQRVREIQFLRKELELKLEELVVEIDALLNIKSRVMKALDACKEPLRVASLCLEERRKRGPSARLHDDVNAELRKEKLVLEEVTVLLENVEKQITEQIRLNRSAKYRLEKDLTEKSTAENIDASCLLMNVRSISLPGGSNAVPPSLPVAQTQWENISNLNLDKAEQQRRSSESLRVLVETVLQQTTADIQKQVQATTTAFQLNIQQVKSHKLQIEEKLLKVVAEINSQQKIREDLQVSITKKQELLSLAQARLALRRQRPGKEQCRDPAQVQISAHVQQLTVSINKLHEDVARSEHEQRALVRCQVSLQEAVNTKANCLYIDEVVCKQLREPFPYMV